MPRRPQTTREMRREVARTLGVPEGDSGRTVRDPWGLAIWVGLRRVMDHLGARNAGSRYRHIGQIIPTLTEPDGPPEKRKTTRLYRRTREGQTVIAVVKRRGRWEFSTLYPESGKKKTAVRAGGRRPNPGPDLGSVQGHTSGDSPPSGSARGKRWSRGPRYAQSTTPRLLLLVGGVVALGHYLQRRQAA